MQLKMTTEKNKQQRRQKKQQRRQKKATCLIGGEGARMPDDHGYHLLPSGAGGQLLPQKQLERGK
jgi:hypothetical protein